MLFRRKAKRRAGDSNWPMWKENQRLAKQEVVQPVAEQTEVPNQRKLIQLSNGTYTYVYPAQSKDVFPVKPKEPFLIKTKSGIVIDYCDIVPVKSDADISGPKTV